MLAADRNPAIWTSQNEYNMQTNHPDLSYFTTTLQNYLNDYHPQLMSDASFIKTRSEQASEMFARCVRDGCSCMEAVQQANSALHAGLAFSKYQTILSVLEQDFEAISEQQRRSVAERMLPVCEPVFSLYEINDDFEYSPEFDILTFELIGTIQIYLDEHGVQ